MREIWAADCETDPFKEGRIPQPFIWGCYNGFDYHEFDSTDDFIDFISERDCIVYAHNGGKFDWHYCLHHLEPFEPIMVIAGRLSKFKIGYAEFRDSYNILPMPLSHWNKDVFDYTLLEPGVRDIPKNHAKIQKYLKSDCVNLFEIINKYIDNYGLNLTQAGSAMKMWQKISEIKAPETSAFFYESIAPYYYGGRVQCFQSGIIDHDFQVIDINSAYPYAMMHKHPYGDIYHVSNKLPSRVTSIERCFIHLCGVSFGAFPYRTCEGLDFPNDLIKRDFHITGWEYLAALDTDTLGDHEIIQVLRFHDEIDFVDYVDHFYDMKVKAKASDDKAEYIFAKLFLNSLYGKFAANPEKYHEYTVVEPRYIEVAEESGGYNYSAMLDKWALMSRPLEGDKARYYNVAVAASITGFVRAYLWTAINQCEDVLYCDTDSIACRTSGDLEIDPTTLGAWDVEANCSKGAIAGKKLYAFKNGDKWKTASKGVRLTHQEIWKIAQGESVTYTSESPSYSLKRGIGFISRKITKSA